MTGYEQRIFQGWQKSAADRLKDQKMLEVTLKKALGHEVENVLPTGEVVNVPLIDLLVIKKIGFDLENPKNIDLKVYSAVLGETKAEMVVETQNASQIFKGITAGAKPNGSDTEQGK